MKRFRFRLDTVLGVRRHELTLKRAELSRAQVEAQRIAKWLAQVGERAEQGSTTLHALAQAGIPAGEFAAGYRGAAVLLRAIGEVRTRETEALAAVGRARQAVLQAHTRVRALEKLRERAQLEYNREAARIEQAEFDEIAARRSGGSA